VRALRPPQPWTPGRPASGYDFDTLADDLAAVIDHFDLRDILTFIRATPDGQADRHLGGDRGVMMS
jgi:hypothetical protein